MSTPADRALALLEHLLIDEESDAILEALVRGWMTGSELVALIAYGDEDRRPWQVLTDPAVAELWSIAHAAMYVGGTVPSRLAGETDPDYLERARVAASQPAGVFTGARKTIEPAIKPLLTGGQRVTVVPSPGGDCWQVIVITYAAETPDPDAVRRTLEGAQGEVLSMLPGGIKLDYRVAPGWSIAEFEAAYAGQTIADFEADFTSIGEFETRLPA